MKIIIRQICIVDPFSPHHLLIKDVLIDDGTIRKIDEPNSIKTQPDQEIIGTGKYLSIGWFDLHVNFREPGFEYKEDLLSGCKAAIAGGFTGVLCMPSTLPPIQSKSEIELITTKTKNELPDVFAAGALSVNLEGKDLSEMYDMSRSGALAFTDDKKSVQDASLMLRALQYSRNFNGVIFSYAEDKTLAANGQMNEGVTSTRLGLKAIPSMAEEIMINRDLYLAEYAETGIHFSTISTTKSVQLIREAKKKGMNVTCDVASHQLLLDDSMLSDFDTKYKVKPPLRSKEDVESLKKAVADGTIDAICSDHMPEDVENKKMEFELAAPGMIGLETAFAVANTALRETIAIEKLIEKFTINPRKILSLSLPSISEGQPANLTLFDPDLEWLVEEHHIKSKSKNCPFLGTRLKGKPVAVFNKGMFASC